MDFRQQCPSSTMQLATCALCTPLRLGRWQAAPVGGAAVREASARARQRRTRPPGRTPTRQTSAEGLPRQSTSPKSSPASPAWPYLRMRAKHSGEKGRGAGRRKRRGEKGCERDRDKPGDGAATEQPHRLDIIGRSYEPHQSARASLFCRRARCIRSPATFHPLPTKTAALILSARRSDPLPRVCLAVRLVTLFHSASTHVSWVSCGPSRPAWPATRQLMSPAAALIARPSDIAAVSHCSLCLDLATTPRRRVRRLRS